MGIVINLLNGLHKLKEAWPIINGNFTSVKNNYDAHVGGTADKHAAQSITYNGGFNNKFDVKAALDQAKAEIDTIVVNASVDPEVALARQSSVKSKTFVTLDARLEESEQDIASYMISIIPHASIQAAVDAIPDGARLFFPPGTFTVSADTIVDKNIVLVGIPGKSIIKIADNTRIRYILKYDSIENVHIYGITFDMNVQNMPAYQASEYLNGSYNQAFYCTGITGKVDISSCKFINLYNEAVFFYTTTCSVRINNCVFTSPAQAQNLRLSHVVMQTMGGTGNAIIENCVFDNAAPTDPQYGVNSIGAEGVKIQTIIRNCRHNYSGRNNVGGHRLLPIDLYGNCNNFTIENNQLYDCQWGFVRIEACQNITVKNNDFYYNTGIECSDPMIWISSTPVYTQNGRDIRILDNNFYADSASKIDDLISIYHTDWSKPLTGIEVRNNHVCGNVERFVRLIAGFNGIKIAGNESFEYDGVIPRKLLYLSRIGSVEPSTDITAEADTFCYGLEVKDNRWYSGAGAVLGELQTYTGTVEFVIIEHNDLKGTTGMGSGIKLNNMPCIIRNNYLRNNPEGVWIVGDKKAYLFNNVCETMDGGAAFYLTDATDYVQAYNYYNGVLVT